MQSFVYIPNLLCSQDRVGVGNTQLSPNCSIWSQATISIDCCGICSLTHFLFFLCPSSTALWVSGGKDLFRQPLSSGEEGVLGWQAQVIVLSSSCSRNGYSMSSMTLSAWLASDTDFCSWWTCGLFPWLHLCLVNWLHLDLGGAVRALKSACSFHLFWPGQPAL